MDKEPNLDIDLLEQEIMKKDISDVEKERLLFDRMVQNVLRIRNSKASTSISNLFGRKLDSSINVKGVEFPREGKKAKKYYMYQGDLLHLYRYFILLYHHCTLFLQARLSFPGKASTSYLRRYRSRKVKSSKCVTWRRARV